ncbi:MAG: hypothetical protein ACYCWW_02520 [Deltaproteobacteria bacterium]
MPKPVEPTTLSDASLEPLLAAPASSVTAPAELALALALAAVERRRPEVLWALAGHPERAVVKAAKRGLHLLRSRGVAVGEPERPAAPPSRAAEPEELPPCHATAIDGFGDRALFVPMKRAKGVELWQLILSDERGLVEIEPIELSRRQLRAFFGAQSSEGALAAREVSRERAAALIAEAVALAPDAPLTPRAKALLERLGGGEPKAAQPSSASALPLPDERARLLESSALFEEPELASFVPPEDELRSLAQKLDEIQVSPLLLDERQRAERFEHAIAQAVVTYFSPARRGRLARRLFELSDRWLADGRLPAAERAQAAARQLVAAGDILENPFARRLFARIFPPPPPPKREGSAPPEPAPGPSGLILP